MKKLIQENEAIAFGHLMVIKVIKWVRSKYPEHFERITLRSYVALFDLSIQHGGLKEYVMNKLEKKWKSNPPKRTCWLCCGKKISSIE